MALITYHFRRVSQKPILGLLRLGIGKVRFSDSSTFNGLRPLKVVMHPYIAEGVAFCDTLFCGGGAGKGLPDRNSPLNLGPERPSMTTDCPFPVPPASQLKSINPDISSVSRMMAQDRRAGTSQGRDRIWAGDKMAFAFSQE